MEITGRVIHAMETRSGVSSRTGNPWASRDYVLEIPNGQYSPRHFVFTVFGEDRIRQFALRKDEEVTIHFDVDANEYNGRWYNRITAYNVTRPNAPAQTQIGQGASAQPMPTDNGANTVGTNAHAQGDDDLPF